MILTGHSGVYSLHQLTGTEIDILLTIVRTADKRCFNEQDDDGIWYSNDDFILALSDDQRAVLRKLGEEIEMMLSE